jgi:hypothetical protein
MRLLLVVGTLALAALGAWFLLRSPAPPPDDEGLERPPGTESRGPRPVPAPGLPTRAPDPTAPTTGPGGRGPAKPVEGRGDLVVVPVPAEGSTVPDDLRMSLEYVGAALEGSPLPAPEPGGRHRFRSIPEGEYRLRLFSDRILDATATVRVRDGQEEAVEVPLVAGGFAEVKVTYLDGEPPPQVTLALKDESGAPATARFEGRGKSATSPRTGAVVTMPAEVVVSALRPGRYVLRATSGDEYDEQAFEVRAGEGAAVAMKVRR